MEEEFVEIDVEDSCLYEDDEIDVNYEFDAPMFFDFSKPESFWDASEAEQWFEFAKSYPPSRKNHRKNQTFLSCFVVFENGVNFLFLFIFGVCLCSISNEDEK